MDFVGVYKINSAKAWMSCQTAFLKMGYTWPASGSNPFPIDMMANKTMPKFIIVQKERKTIYYRDSENQLGEGVKQCEALKEMIVEWED